jgi:hypothetical protein
MSLAAHPVCRSKNYHYKTNSPLSLCQAKNGGFSGFVSLLLLQGQIKNPDILEIDNAILVKVTQVVIRAEYRGV